MKHQVYEFIVNSDNCDCKITITKGRTVDKVKVEGLMKENVDRDEISYLAAAPATHVTSFSGSGLPYPNKEIAYMNTPNKGIVKLELRKFVINLLMPNTYYTQLGNNIVEPTLLIKYSNGNNEKIMRIPVGNRIPFRSQQYPEGRTGPNFYSAGNHMPIRSQYDLIIDSGYPKVNRIPENHWGLRPPN